MRPVLRINLFGIALVVAAVTLGGCGGGGQKTAESLRVGHCEVHQVSQALSAVEAGIEGLRSRPPAHREQVLQAMRENTAAIQGQLPELEECAEDNYREAALGRPVHRPEAPPPAGRRGIVVGYRVGPARIEPGQEGHPASPCSTINHDPRPVYVYPDSPICARLTPRQRLLVVNATGIGGSAAVAIRVQIGDYEVWIGPDQRGLIPAPIGTYLGHGSHLMHVVGGLGDTILVLPKNCGVRRTTAPDEKNCFPE
jgi:hypothetical protein